ncbi:MAG: hypothetical protein LUI14_13790, partial [Lachnospiraceae bacterium]|nr:hypothetical protein [Lachnospiraceae bacterium]
TVNKVLKKFFVSLRGSDPGLPREEMDVMCNLSEGIFEQGEARGEAKGMLKKAMETAYTLHDMGLTDQQIAKAVNYSLDTVKEWIESYERTCNS